MASIEAVAACFLMLNISWPCLAFPKQRLANISREDIKHQEMLPPDHIAGGHMEHDGDLNKDFHHEAFLGTLVKEGKLDFNNLDGYRKLIGVFHKVDRNKDHLLDKEELQDWIHDRILEHYNHAKANSDEVFKKVDLDKDDLIKWYEYKASLVDIDPENLQNVSCEFLQFLIRTVFNAKENWIYACPIVLKVS